MLRVRSQQYQKGGKVARFECKGRSPELTKLDYFYSVLVLGSQILQALKDTNERSSGSCFEVGEECEAEQKEKQEAAKLFAEEKGMLVRGFHLFPFPKQSY